MPSSVPYRVSVGCRGGHYPLVVSPVAGNVGPGTGPVVVGLPGKSGRLVEALPVGRQPLVVGEQLLKKKFLFKSIFG